MRIILILLLLPFSVSLLAQASLTGKITDTQTGTPLMGAYVFLAETQLGTTTDAEGYFSLRNIPYGKYDLIVSYLGYEDQQQPLFFRESGNYKKDIALQAGSIELSGVDIITDSQRKWKRRYRRFLQALLGEGPFAANCNILNPEALYFTEDKEGLKAMATDLLEVDNPDLGYTVYFLLEHFTQKGYQTSYSGKPFFEAQHAGNEETAATWQKNRKQAYAGSTRHFYRSLYHNQLRQEGFVIAHAKLEDRSIFTEQRVLLAKNVLQDSLLQFPDFLKVVYGRKHGKASAYRPAGRRGTIVAGDSMGQISYLFLRNEGVAIDSNGIPERPEMLLSYGHWATTGLADLLPRYYQADDGMEQ